MNSLIKYNVSNFEIIVTCFDYTDLTVKHTKNLELLLVLGLSKNGRFSKIRNECSFRVYKIV